MVFRIQLPLEVERPSDHLSSRQTVTVQLIFERGKWRSQAQDPAISTLMCDSMEEAIIAAAREIMQEWAATTTP